MARYNRTHLKFLCIRNSRFHGYVKDKLYSQKFDEEECKDIEQMIKIPGSRNKEYRDQWDREPYYSENNWKQFKVRHQWQWHRYKSGCKNRVIIPQHKKYDTCENYYTYDWYYDLDKNIVYNQEVTSFSTYSE